MQDHSHHVQELHEVGFFLILGRSVSLHSCAWCSVRSSLHTSGAHLTAALQGAIAMGAMLPPMPPSIRPLDTNSLQKNSGTTFGGLGFSFYICPKQI